MDGNNIRKLLKPYYTSMLSVFISVVSLCIVSAISMAGKTAIEIELDGIGMNGMTVTAYSASGENITDETLYDVLSDCDDISRLTPVLYKSATITLSNGVEMPCICWGISPMAKDVVNLKHLYGRIMAGYDVDNNSMVCMVDENIALKSYGRGNITGKQRYITLDGGTNKFEIIGVVNKTSSVLNGMSGETIPDFVYIPYTTMKNLGNIRSFHQIIINVDNSDISEDTIKRYITANTQLPINTVLNITNLSRQRESINNIVNVAFFTLFLVSCVAIIVCGISVAASVNTAVINSRHDIGIKISLGASRFDIMKEFLFLSILSCIIGVVAGFLFGTVFLILLNLVLKTAYYFDYKLIMYGVSATILLAVIFSLYPSYKAAGLVPIKALSRE